MWQYALPTRKILSWSVTADYACQHIGYTELEQMGSDKAAGDAKLTFINPSVEKRPGSNQLAWGAVG
jgi:hypothetical protein